MLDRSLHTRWLRWPQTGDELQPRTQELSRRVPKAGWASAPVRANDGGAPELVPVCLPYDYVTCNFTPVATNNSKTSLPVRMLHEVEVSARDYVLLRERDVHAVAEPEQPDKDMGMYL